MAERNENELIQRLKDDGKNIFSISKLNTINHCLLETKFTYIDDNRGLDSVYGVLGTGVHEMLEDLYNDRIDSSALSIGLQEQLEEAELGGYEFPKDFRGGNTIRDSWVTDMEHFCKHYKPMDGKFETEKFYMMPVSSDDLMIGYIDLIEYRDDNHIFIYDFKTSSDFKKADLRHHGRQLIVYAMALEEQGYIIDGIAWIMLKYVEAEYTIRGKKKTKILHRGKIGTGLSSVAEKMLSDAGYDDIDIDIMICDLEENNSLNDLPKEIRNKIKIKQYIREYPYTKENVNETMAYIQDGIKKFKSVKDSGLWEPLNINNKESFFCNVLCSHRKHCPAIQEYNLLQTLNDTDDEDLF